MKNYLFMYGWKKQYIVLSITDYDNTEDIKINLLFHYYSN